MEKSIPLVRLRAICATIVLMATITTFSTAFAQSGGVTLGPGDKLLLIMPSGRNPMSTYTLDKRGVLDMGIYGKVTLKDRTLDEATALIRAHMAKYLKQAGKIKVLLDRPKKAVAVTGQVKNPGIVSVYENVDIWGAIQEAGGIAEAGDLGGVTLIREGVEIPVDLAAYLTRESSFDLPSLHTGDTIFVPVDPSRASEGKGIAAFLGGRALQRKIFVIGAVIAPGVFDRTDEVDLWSAIGLARGPSADADLAHVRVLTQNESSVVDLIHQTEGSAKAHFPYAQSAVIIYVPSKMDNMDTGSGEYINVLGTVTRPGRFSVAGPMKLVDIVAIAGGPTDRGRLSKVRVVEDRAGYTMAQVFDLDDYLKEGGMEGRVMIKPGSTVYIGPSIGSSFELPLRIITDIALVASTAALWVTIAKGF